MLPGMKRGKGRRSDDTMDDDSDEKDTKRKFRNLSEKKRRDQFNLLVNELGSMVATGGRKMDKSTVLKSTISFLKNHNEIATRSRAHEIQEDWKPSFLTNEEFTHLVLEAIDGFIVVFSTSGQIFYASENVTPLLGHHPNELLNVTIFDLAGEEDQNNLYNVLLAPVEEDGQVSFSCRLRRGGSEAKEAPTYDLVHFIGYYRAEADISETDNRSVFVGTGRLQTPQLIREMSLGDAKSEFTSRHSLEWKFLFLDHRAPPIIGYLPFELLGTSGYDYYHVDDLDSVVTCHENLMQKGEGTSCFYRFLTKGQQWIWLQTRFYITYHQWNSKPEFVVCTHRVISYGDVLKQNKKEQNGFESFHAPSVQQAQWTSSSSKERFAYEASSECTSMSADSPASKHSTPSTTNTRLSQSTQFFEPPQYVTAIPLQPVVASFPSPIAPVEMSHEQTILHADLQRKHAELQASIGQQQAELVALSEQLLMARLGLLQPQSPTQARQAYAGAVSSTTPQNVAQQSNVLYSPPDSNTSPSLTELKVIGRGEDLGPR